MFFVIISQFCCLRMIFLQEDSKTLVQLASEVNAVSSANAKQESLNESLIKYLSYTARANLCPMQAVIGGIVAQEVMKVSTVFTAKCS